MDVEWSAPQKQSVEEYQSTSSEVRQPRLSKNDHQSRLQVKQEVSVPSAKNQLFKYAQTDSELSQFEWILVSGDAHPRFYDQNEDRPSEVALHRLEIEEGEINVPVSSSLENISDRQQRRVNFAYEGSYWAIVFPNDSTYSSFSNDLNNKLFESIYESVNTQKNREVHLGRDFASRLFADCASDEMDWRDDESHPDIKEEEQIDKLSHPMTPVPQQDVEEYKISFIKPAISDNSYVIRRNRIDTLRSVETGIKSGSSSFQLQSQDSQPIEPTSIMLAEEERRMAILSEQQKDKLFYADIETGKIIQEWSFARDSTTVPMQDIVAETKNAPAENRSSFLGFGKNRLCRWDTRVSEGIVQEYNQELDSLSGKDYSTNTNFTSMATAGDGSVVVGSLDGKVRLYSNKLTLRRASTAFPAIGTPITSIDISHDGKWVIATTDTFIEVIRTVAKDNKGQQLDGFKKSLGSAAYSPKLLKLKPEDRASLDRAPLRKGQFTLVTEENIKERWIVATCGNASVLWNFRHIKASTADQRSMGGMATITSYNLIHKKEKLVDSCFIHDPKHKSSECDSLVVATSNKVWTFAES